MSPATGKCTTVVAGADLEGVFKNKGPQGYSAIDPYFLPECLVVNSYFFKVFVGNNKVEITVSGIVTFTSNPT